jgi:acetyltransferase-like isoleucine patch superfamily enzyme
MRKRILKRLVSALATIFVSPLLISFFIFARLTSGDAALEPHSQLLALLPGKAGSYLRVAFYRRVLAECHSTAFISFGTLFSKVESRIGRHVYIGPYCLLGTVTLEQDVLLGSAVQIPSGQHTHGTARLDIPLREQTGEPTRVTVGRDSWIGSGSILLSDVSPQTVVAAGSVVVKAHPRRVVLAGVPAKVIKSRESTTSECIENILAP